jgi:hypothetical protein
MITAMMSPKLMNLDITPDQPLPPSRRSACADAALLAEIERVKKMTINERMLEALALGQDLSALFPTNSSVSDHGKSNQADNS